MKKNEETNIEVRKTDMNDIAHSLFLGNHASCCTAIGDGCNSWSAPYYIINKCISSIEIVDGKQSIGNTMCYIAKVDGILTGYDVKRLRSGIVIDGYPCFLKFLFCIQVVQVILKRTEPQPGSVIDGFNGGFKFPAFGFFALVAVAAPGSRQTVICVPVNIYDVRNIRSDCQNGFRRVKQIDGHPNNLQLLLEPCGQHFHKRNVMQFDRLIPVPHAVQVGNRAFNADSWR